LTILRDEGFLSLYKGINSKIIQSVLTAAILFAGQRRIFEVTKKVLLCSLTIRALVLTRVHHFRLSTLSQNKIRLSNGRSVLYLINPLGLRGQS